MAFVKTTAGANACAEGGFSAACNGGSVKLYTSADVLLVSFTLSNPAFGTVSNRVLTMAGGAKTATPSANGVAAKYKVFTSGAVDLGGGTVTATGGGGDCTIGNTTIATTNDVTLNTFTHTEPTN